MKTFLHLWQYLAKFCLEWEMLQIRVVKKIKTHILCSVTFFPENDAVFEMTKNAMEPDRPQMKTLDVCFACWVPKPKHTHTHTHSEYLLFSTVTMVSRTRLNITLWVLPPVDWHTFIIWLCVSQYSDETLSVLKATAYCNAFFSALTRFVKEIDEYVNAVCMTRTFRLRVLAVAPLEPPVWPVYSMSLIIVQQIIVLLYRVLLLFLPGLNTELIFPWQVVSKWVASAFGYIHTALELRHRNMLRCYEMTKQSPLYWTHTERTNVALEFIHGSKF
jgi:hypothetical protein